MTYENLEIAVNDGVGVIWMNRPEVRNAFNDAMITELTRAFQAVDADPGVRAVVLAGRGPAFCAGADLNWMKKMAGYSVEENRADALGLATMMNTVYMMKKPTIARVHGPAFAGGMGLVAACDIAVAAEAAEFCLSEVKLGLAAATIGPYVLAAIGERQARRYFLTAERFSAAEAMRIGLVHNVVPTNELDACVDALLAHLLAASPAAIAASKELIRSVAHGAIDPEMIADTAARIAAARASTDGKEGIRAFLEKRKPAWTRTH
ncbi:MAG: enoyl-CoA hydratase/isomerase family protein [Betaproteobacteria bacterium]|nr:MAG: enoyl-CoA hydratase/isomerase family protein [Betaproteobacteria bacterium]